MEGLVDDLMRDVITRVGGVDWCVTEFVRVTRHLLPASAFQRLAPELQQGGRTAAGTPMHVQLLGSDPACLAEDGYHPSEKGYAYIADQVAGQLRPAPFSGAGVDLTRSP